VQENARLQTKVKEQETVIAEQKAHIAELETQVAEQLAKIAALTQSLEKCHAQIEEDNRRITDLTEKNENLTETLQNERVQHKDTVNKMESDFAEEKQQMNDAHSAEVESLNHKFNDAEAEHNDYVAKLNADFAARANETEQKHLKELADKEETHKKELVEIKEANLKSSAASNAAHASELKKAYKSVDKKVELAEKACEKRMKAKVAEVKKEAQAEIRKAEKKASEKISLAKDEIKSVKDTGDLFVRDYGFGSVAVVSKYAEELAKFGKLSIADELMDAQKAVRSLCICRSKKGVMLAGFSQSGASVYNVYKKQADLTVAFNDLCSMLKGMSNLPIVITFSGVDRPFVMNFENIVRDATKRKTTVFHNKTLKANGFVSVYFGKE
jgi:DNA repair exonuclease SbcCD ATPase subunit